MTSVLTHGSAHIPTVLGLIGDTAAVDSEYIAAQDIVESVKRVQEPYKKGKP